GRLGSPGNRPPGSLLEFALEPHTTFLPQPSSITPQFAPTGHAFGTQPSGPRSVPPSAAWSDVPLELPAVGWLAEPAGPMFGPASSEPHATIATARASPHSKLRATWSLRP